MGASSLTAAPHSDALYYLRAQGFITLSFAAFIAAMVAIVFLFTTGKIKIHQWPWILLGIGGVAITVYFGAKSLLVDTPSITLAGDSLRVGSAELRLDETTQLEYRGSLDDLKPPDSHERGFFRLPGARGFPPQFDGGPRVHVRTSAGELSFQPLLYGPAAYFSAAASRDATALVHGLLRFGDGGNARDWLAAIFVEVEGEPAPPASFRTFLIVYLFIAVPVFAFLGGLVILGIRKRLGS